MGLDIEEPSYLERTLKAFYRAEDTPGSSPRIGCGALRQDLRRANLHSAFAKARRVASNHGPDALSLCSREAEAWSAFASIGTRSVLALAIPR
jgi:hypothetical protein